MAIKAPFVQACLDQLFSRVRTANNFIEQPVPLALLEQPRTVL